MITVSRLARQFNLSRSTLLYYDRIGLLRPSDRSRSNYRLYDREDRKRLEKICHYRAIGLPLKVIQRILDAADEGTGAALEQRLLEINRQIEALRGQKTVIERLLGSLALETTREGLNREKWTALLRATGMGDEDMIQWHVEFERLFPDDHQAFLESLGIPDQDVEAIRAFSRQHPPEPSPDNH